MCPLCGIVCHINTLDPEGFEKRYPEILVVGYGCRVCRDCEQDIVPGDRVVTRGEPLREGIVVLIVACAGGHKLFRVEYADGLTGTYPRIKLAKRSAVPYS